MLTTVDKTYPTAKTISIGSTIRFSKTTSVPSDKGTMVQSVMAEMNGSAFFRPDK